MGVAWDRPWRRGSQHPLLRNTQSCLETLLQVEKPRPRDVSISLGINPVVRPKAAATAFGSKGPEAHGSRDHSGLDGRFLIGQRGHTFGAGPMAPFWETEAGLKDGSKQDSGIELIRQELELNSRLVTDAYVAINLSRTFYLCKKNGLKLCGLREVRTNWSPTAGKVLHTLTHLSLALCGRRRRRAAPVDR